MPKFFVTGGSGLIGTSLVQQLVEQNIEVLALSRSDESSNKLIALGAQVLKGSVEDSQILKAGVEQTDGVIHLAFNGVEGDKNTLESLGEALIGTSKFLVHTSTLISFAGPIGELKNEYSPQKLPPTAIYKRFENEQVISKLVQQGIRALIVRIPQVTHADVDHKGFIPKLIDLAKSNGVSFYAEDGSNHWPAVHRHDAAKLYILAATNGKPGEQFNAVHELATSKDIATTIANKLGLNAKSVTKEELLEKFGQIGGVFATNIEVSSSETQRILGWKPTEIGLLEDIKDNYSI
ncbi:hypothetical protein WICMUC_000692 [Wickerhamomyces mucosus]|uniref:NAD-dependent epimerase/dehydratase domain-containing protein n=1 Tax=Wickerhamomyces mucosus TaxID=1378264 RepID=A0A9P8PZ81_9ASCO|nr:hypothetical protein WICMUC_000692 [Wickerhamomyces mucosus]